MLPVSSRQDWFCIVGLAHIAVQADLTRADTITRNGPQGFEGRGGSRFEKGALTISKSKCLGEQN